MCDLFRQRREIAMRAVRYHGPKEPFRLDDVERPEPGPGEVRVRIEAAGVCHTELHFESGLLDLGVAPVTMGHEIAGTVDALGEGVTERSVGDRVIVYYYAGCGECEWCRRGDENLCGQLRAEYGFFNDGGYAEAIVVPVRNAVRLPDHVSFEEAAPVGCGVTTAIHGCNLAGVGAGDVVVAYGVGAVGYGVIQVAKLRGATVIGVGRTPAKLDRARQLGADHTINAADAVAAGETVAERVRALTDGRGADVVFELVGTAETMPQAVAMLAKRGTLVFVGYSFDSLETHPIGLVIGEVSIMGSVGNTLAELQEAVRLLGEGKVKTLVDRTLPLEAFSEGLDAVRKGEVMGRVVLKP
jgi:alcohol dehydrogenase, propanol-preferring